MLAVVLVVVLVVDDVVFDVDYIVFVVVAVIGVNFVVWVTSNFDQRLLVRKSCLGIGVGW